MDKEIFIYNSLSRNKERFTSKLPEVVSMYVCGLTPQDHIHLGHAKTFITFDVIRRILEHFGYKVNFLTNFTDIDDKIIAKANLTSEPPQFLAERYIDSCLEDFKALNIKPASFYPRATAHIPEMIEMIEVLISKGFAYEVAGEVYFRVKKFVGYGKLSGQTLADLQTAVRIEPQENKEEALDFALWKASKPLEPSWPSPWGRGRPGWHIECSAMNLKYLGMGFDIHGGGQDLVFPHHDNEIAQAEAYTGETPYARYFMHSGLFNLKDSKMSKSVGNVVSLKEVFMKYDPMVVRLLVLKAHYRSPMDFYPEVLEESAETLLKLKDLYYHLKMMSERGGESKLADDIHTEAKIDTFILRFQEPLLDDFNYAASLGILFQFLNEITQTKFGSKEVFTRALGEVILALDTLGLNFKEEEINRNLIELLLKYRDELRKKGNYQEADSIRKYLLNNGLIVQDSPFGTRFYRNTKKNNIR